MNDFFEEYIDEMVHKETEMSETLFQVNAHRIEVDRIKKKWADSGMLELDALKYPEIIAPFLEQHRTTHYPRSMASINTTQRINDKED